jgi:hypothetical protein
MNCPGCGKSMFLAGSLGTWNDHLTGYQVVVYAICQECMDKLEKATPEERAAFTQMCERETGKEGLH